jgi:hypothetical protein
MYEPTYPLITRDPVSGGELFVTRLECPSSGIVIEGRFSLGWIGRLSPDQLVFVGLLAQHRGNLQKVAADLGFSYNTARNRMDDIAAALGGAPEPASPAPRTAVLDQLAGGEISFEEALRKLKD